MSVKSMEKDPDRLTLTVTAEYDVTAERAWELWSDPRQLERWWGPPTYPATFEQHDLTTGGSATYFMTGPEGQRHRGWWRIIEADAPRTLVLDDGFADESGAPVDTMPTTRMRVDLTDRGDGVTMTMVSTFPSLEAMDQMIEMGMLEGLGEAMSQIDAVLASS